jgi:hypothetical protein
MLYDSEMYGLMMAALVQPKSVAIEIYYNKSLRIRGLYHSFMRVRKSILLKTLARTQVNFLVKICIFEYKITYMG